MYSFVYGAAHALARAMALGGGAILLGVVVLTCVSIAGRVFVPLDIGLGPVRGIYDYTEIGMAAAVFAFLPWCQISRGHAAVDLFINVFPDVMNRVLDLVFDLAMLAAASLIAWRLYLGMMDKLRYGETTLIAQMPVWQGYAASLVGASAFVFVSAVCVLRAAQALVAPAAQASAHE